MVEVKAKKSGTTLYLSSQHGQLFKQLLGHAFAWNRITNGGRGTHTLVTTSGVKVSSSVRKVAQGLGIKSHHYYSVYSGSLNIGNISFKKNY